MAASVTSREPAASASIAVEKTHTLIIRTIETQIIDFIRITSVLIW